MSERLCGTCRHWQPPDPREDNAPGHGACARLPANDDYSAGPECRDSPAFTEDGERRSSCLRTRADFGCVLHESKGA